MSKAHFTGNTHEVGIQVAGLDELQKKLASFPQKLRMSIEKKAIKRGLQELLNAIRAATPVDTGYLVSSLKVTTRGSSKTGMVGGSVVANAPHAHLVEYGFTHTGHYDRSLIFNKKVRGSNTRRGVTHVPARPFMRSTTERMAERMLDIFEEALVESIDEVFGGA